MAAAEAEIRRLTSELARRLPERESPDVQTVHDARREQRLRHVVTPEPEVWKACYEESCARESEANPQFRGVVNRILSGAQQLHHGRKVAAGGKPDRQGLTIGWTEEDLQR